MQEVRKIRRLRCIYRKEPETRRWEKERASLKKECLDIRKEEVGGPKKEKTLSRKEKVVDRPQEARTPDEGSNCNIEKAESSQSAQAKMRIPRPPDWTCRSVQQILK